LTGGSTTSKTTPATPPPPRRRRLGTQRSPTLCTRCESGFPVLPLPERPAGQPPIWRQRGGEHEVVHKTPPSYCRRGGNGPRSVSATR
jgi:hypothetical protein